jgi:hypothetical protein
MGNGGPLILGSFQGLTKGRRKGSDEAARRSAKPCVIDSALFSSLDSFVVLLAIRRKGFGTVCVNEKRNEH